MHGKGNYIKSFLNVEQGTFFLTNERLFFNKVSLGMQFAVGAFSGLLDGDKFLFEARFEDIRSFIRKRHGFTYKYVLTTSRGEYPIQFVQDTPVWIDQIVKALKARCPEAVVTESADGFIVS